MQAAAVSTGAIRVLLVVAKAQFRLKPRLHPLGSTGQVGANNTPRVEQFASMLPIVQALAVGYAMLQ